jgi:hypothetical protein
MRLFTAWLCLALPFATFDAASAETVLKQLKLEGVVYTNYSYDITKHSQDKNGVDIQRLYFIVQENLAEKVAFRITTDIFQNTKQSADGYSYYRGWDIRLKHAFVTFKEIYPKADLSFGMVDLPWVPWEEKIFQHRFVSTVFMDTEKRLTSTDLGVTLRGMLSGDHLEYHAAIMNGETYAAPEVSKFKDYHLRLSLTPLPRHTFLKGLRLTAFGNLNDRDSNHRNTRAVGYLSYEHPRFTLAGGYWWLMDERPTDSKLILRARSVGPSVYGIVKLGSRYWVMARMDRLDPNTAEQSKDDLRTRIIGGAGVQIADGVKLFLDAQTFDVETESKDLKDSRTAFAHLEIKY